MNSLKHFSLTIFILCLLENSVDQYFQLLTNLVKKSFWGSASRAFAFYFTSNDELIEILQNTMKTYDGKPIMIVILNSSEFLEQSYICLLHCSNALFTVMIAKFRRAIDITCLLSIERNEIFLNFFGRGTNHSTESIFIYE